MNSKPHRRPGHARRRLDRQFERLGRQFPAVSGFLRWVRKPSVMLIRIPLAILLILGGIFSILPLLGIWMLPLGLLLLALDVPLLEAPVGRAIVRLQRWWMGLRRKRTARRAQTNTQAS